MQSSTPARRPKRESLSQGKRIRPVHKIAAGRDLIARQLAYDRKTVARASRSWWTSVSWSECAHSTNGAMTKTLPAVVPTSTPSMSPVESSVN
jgi:hypothetical protein